MCDLRTRLPDDGRLLIWSLKRVGVRYPPCAVLRSVVPVLHLCIAKMGHRVYLLPFKSRAELEIALGAIRLVGEL